MEHVLLQLKDRNSFLFSELFESTTTLTTIVATFPRGFGIDPTG